MSTEPALDSKTVAASPGKAAKMIRDAVAQAGSWEGAARALNLGIKYLYRYRRALEARGLKFKAAKIGRPKGITTGKGKTRCGACGETGHNARKCPKSAG